MKDYGDIPATDTTEIKQLIIRVKQGELDQCDALSCPGFFSLFTSGVDESHSQAALEADSFGESG